ncbi:gamma-D-glutamate-meso-diaminopimelate muropeptidase [Psychromonas ingrahamii 37]|uniref:Gamma-D-glutamate-meso-diaminopimelate muropeptidase n=1 Tax=Psychromonas ingrahamii (strain DSM 17664 / CCUG 51855 / 37) TaxID=357804 RepID=A1SVP7_PSYIN|nr:ice-binding family protein [Psychromonas ingrahamii]ABM03562.1 gamma-D-glutamate-meso-diaminopimelate muropeptidase [Psychromonas ingrahamii 37]
MKNKTLKKGHVFSGGLLALSMLGSISVASAANGFVEDFSGGNLPSHLEAVGGVGTWYSQGTRCCSGQVGGAVFEDGHVRFQGRDTRGDYSGGLRSYLRTIETDYSSVSFVAEVTVTIPEVPRSGRNIVFFGLGPVLPVDKYGGPGTEAGSGISIGTLPTNFAPQFQVWNGVKPETKADVACGGNGTHRMRLEWNAETKTAVTSIDQDYSGGTFSADCTLPPITSFADQPNGSGRIFIGGDWDAIFDDLEVTIAHISPFKSHAAIAGGAINIAASSTVNGDLAAQAAVVIGANSVVHNIYAGAAVTTGALSTVENIFSGAAAGIGANAEAQNIHAGAAITLGASGQVQAVYAGAAITLGAGASTNGVLNDDANGDQYADAEDIHNSGNMAKVIAEITKTQSALSALKPSSANGPLYTTMGTRTLAPGVWEGSAVSIAASSTITFDADEYTDNKDHVWVINLSEALTVGASTHFEIIGLGNGDTASIIWNVGAAVTLGAGTSFRGTAFVGGAVNAATSSVSCGHLYATGAISIGSIGVDSAGSPITCENSDAVFTYLETLD